MSQQASSNAADVASAAVARDGQEIAPATPTQPPKAPEVHRSLLAFASAARAVPFLLHLCSSKLTSPHSNRLTWKLMRLASSHPLPLLPTPLMLPTSNKKKISSQNTEYCPTAPLCCAGIIRRYRWRTLPTLRTLTFFSGASVCRFCGSSDG